MAAIFISLAAVYQHYCVYCFVPYSIHFMVILLCCFWFSQLMLSHYSPTIILIYKKCSIMYIICLLHARTNNKTFIEHACTLLEKLDACLSCLSDPECITMLHGSTVRNTRSKINLFVQSHWNESHVFTLSMSPLGCWQYPVQHTSLYLPSAI